MIVIQTLLSYEKSKVEQQAGHGRRFIYIEETETRFLGLIEGYYACENKYHQCCIILAPERLR